VGMLWAVCIKLYKVKLPWMQLAKITFISILASLAAHLVAIRLSPLWGLVFGGGASLLVLFGLFYLMRVLEPEDRDRLQHVTHILPRRFGVPANRLLSMLVRSNYRVPLTDNA